MGLKSLILTRIPVGCRHDSLIALVTAPSHTHTHTHTRARTHARAQNSVTYRGYADDTVLWGSS